MYHLFVCNLVSNRQRGFLGSSFCTTCQYDVLGILINVDDCGNAFTVASRDVTKALELTPQHRLVAQSCPVGITDRLLSWSYSYPPKWTHSLLVRGHMCNPWSVTSSPIHGSTRRPLIFLFDHDGALNFIARGKLLLYGNNVKIILFSEPTDIVNTTNRLLSDVDAMDW